MRPIYAGRKLPALIFGTFAATAALATPAFAQSLIDNSGVKGTLSFLGIIAPDRDPIEYHERAPLVVPKTMELPPPAALQASARNAAWPTDPDVAKKLKEKAEASKPVRASGTQGSSQPDNARASIWDVQAGRSSSAPIQANGPDPDTKRDNAYIPNGKLREMGAKFAVQNPDNEDEIRPGYEPKRKYLTDPPAGYRRPSDKASFKKQYGAPVKKDEKEKPIDFVREQYLRQQGSYDPEKGQQ
jgi:hypothetical protein